jgi:hypothetical protein
MDSTMMASASPMPPYFLIRIGKVMQKETKEKIGSLYFPEQYAFMRRELQFGEIVKIGQEAADYMPMAEPGDFLLIHHLVSGKKDDKGHNYYRVGEDDDFNYYVVNAFELPGEMPLAYAVAKGTEIIPTPDYIFLEVPVEEDVSITTESGISFKMPKNKTRDEWTAIMKDNMTRIKQLSRNIPQTHLEQIMIMEDPEKKEKHLYAMSEIKKLEAINLTISKQINKKKYEVFTVAAINPQWHQLIKEEMGEDILPGDKIYFLNIAAQTKMNFSGTEYIVAQSKYFGISEKKLKNSINDFKLHNSTTKKNPNRVGNAAAQYTA